MNTEQRFLNWLATGRTGYSSEYMGFKLLGYNKKRVSHPSDPGDFNRCLVMLQEVFNGDKSQLHKLAGSSAYWDALLPKWNDIEQTFLDEAGYNWSKGTKAPKTYNLLRTILDNVKPNKKDTPVFSINLNSVIDGE
ncbi:hypothetical protein [Pseudoalteromonas sp. R3]|uniref:hypothetical protein n=1 Tax=Pseudoalteromonas sp. R3 TaxID=1709477 RepID=UPI0006B45F2D|nr:hypothetical protein [Pseudoalteromonas sp. R3]AZZ98261.1 hypothetical protein ELR70_14735 [Pseudoalteromonas sp. R3]